MTTVWDLIWTYSGLGWVIGLVSSQASVVWANFAALMVIALNPGEMLDELGVAFFKFDLLFAGMLPTQLVTVFQSAEAFFAAGHFAAYVGLLAYVMSPMVPPLVFLACLDLLILIWVETAIIAVAFMVKGWVWAQGA